MNKYWFLLIFYYDCQLWIFALCSTMFHKSPQIIKWCSKHMSGKSTSGHEMWWCAFMLACLSELRLDIKVMFAVTGAETNTDR